MYLEMFRGESILCNNMVTVGALVVLLIDGNMGTCTYVRINHDMWVMYVHLTVYGRSTER